MRTIEKVGLLILNDDASKFLVCQKGAGDVTAQYIMPGGQFEEDTVEECITNEIMEELGCRVDMATLSFIGDYRDVAAGYEDTDVLIHLYIGQIVGVPTPSTEVEQIHWIGAQDARNLLVSPIVRYQIIPDLVAKGILMP